MKKWMLLAALPLAAQVSYERVLQGPGEDWLTYHGDYRAQRHSPLKQIDVSNVGSLVPKWTFHLEVARRLESVPVVHEGLMYIGNTNEVTALDARTGRRVWQYRDEQVQRKAANRGVAIMGDRVFFITSDCHLTALERRSGALLWQSQFAKTEEGYFCTVAPLALKDRVLVGVSGGESGMRGFVAALSAEKGSELWRTYTVPARGEPGSETWGEFKYLQYGGAATWITGTYDPELNLIYWPTGNPWPDFYGGDRKGDNLYSCAVVALDASTGKMKWHFQFTPGDVHDWDAQSIPVLVDMEFRGQPRKLLLHPNRNGFFYVLDRVTGEYLSAKPFIDQLTWAKGVDDKGRPMRLPGTMPSPGGTRVCPAVRGASNWMSPSFNPATGLIYVPTLEACDVYFSSAKEPEPFKNFTAGGGERIPTEPGKFFLRAIDPKTGERRWEYPMTGPTTAWAGTVTTAGGLVFFGDDDGQLVALDARTGQHLWHYNMGQMLTASPITWSLDGKQYVTICSATDVFTFGLFEPAKPVPVVPERVKPVTTK